MRAPAALSFALHVHCVVAKRCFQGSSSEVTLADGLVACGSRRRYGTYNQEQGLDGVTCTMGSEAQVEVACMEQVGSNYTEHYCFPCIECKSTACVEAITATEGYDCAEFLGEAYTKCTAAEVSLVWLLIGIGCLATCAFCLCICCSPFCYAACCAKRNEKIPAAVCAEGKGSVLEAPGSGVDVEASAAAVETSLQGETINTRAVAGAPVQSPVAAAGAGGGGDLAGRGGGGEC